MKTAIWVIMILLGFLNSSSLIAGETELNSLIKLYHKNKNYYNVITESKRYKLLYPKEKGISEILSIMGEAYYRGGNYNLAVGTFSYCYNRYPLSIGGERSSYLLGVARLERGSPFFAIRNFNEYRYIYKNGKYLEDIAYKISYSSALARDYNYAREQISNYKKDYPAGRYMDKLNWLDSEIINEINRPKKSVWVAALGSLVVPGFGYFYTGKTKMGVLSLLTNATLISMAYRGYANGDKYQMIFFSLLEFSFYQYSIIGGIKSVNEYNDGSSFQKKLKLSLGKEF